MVLFEVKKHIDYKVPDGKLLRIDLQIQNGVVKEISITGDFFIHPETALTEIEEIIINNDINDVEEKLNKYVRQKKVDLIGFNVADLIKVMRQCQID